MTVWKTELFEEPKGTYPIERWLDNLTEQKFAAYDAAVTHVLRNKGMQLLGSPWMKNISMGLYEFHIRHSARQIMNMYANAGEPAPAKAEAILLRVFVSFHGDRIVLLLHGYDKGVDDSAKKQNKEIKEAQRRLKAWKLQETKRVKGSK